MQFERIIEEYLKRKSIPYRSWKDQRKEKKAADTTEQKSGKVLEADFMIYDGEVPYAVECKIYPNNSGIEKWVRAICERPYRKETENHNILMVANVVEPEVRRKLEGEYGLYIWDVKNLLWLLAEFPQLQSDFIGLLRFSVAELIPEEVQMNMPKKPSGGASGKMEN